MALEHLQFLAVFQADDVIGEDRFLDRHRRFRTVFGRVEAPAPTLVRL
jgi:hypothetical protein